MDDKDLFVLFEENHYVGVFSSHKKAVQHMLTTMLNKDHVLVAYASRFGAEEFEFAPSGAETANDDIMYTLMGTTLDKPV